MKTQKLNGRIIWGILMILIYLGMSFLLIFTNLFNDTMSFTMRIVCGILFFCYALFRSYRLIKYRK